MVDKVERPHQFAFELGSPERVGINIPVLDVPESPLPPESMLRQGLDFPEVGEQETVRYFRTLGRRNFSIEDGFYPLGSCTMKYNPRVNEVIAGQSDFAKTHPDQSEEQVQGDLQILHDMQRDLAEITGMDATTLTPMAGSQGEFTGILVVNAYHQSRGDNKRRRVLVPDSAHGTNPATAAMAGFEVVNLKSSESGDVDLDELEKMLSQDPDTYACMMITQPSTHGNFDPNIVRIAQRLHEDGILLYGDGANMNAIIGRAKPGDFGIDVMHLNLHKTTSTPHGGGGPGAGPVCVKAPLAEFLPGPVVDYDPENDKYSFRHPDQSIGRMGGANGNFGVLLRSHAYLRSLGASGLRAISDNAVLNANYLMTLLQPDYDIPYNQGGRHCMHEFVIDTSRLKADFDVSVVDIAKALEEAGFHPPTMGFPLTVHNALMIEPTESETKESLDAFAAEMKRIRSIAETDPDYLKNAPYTTPVRRVDTKRAVLKPILVYQAPSEPTPEI